MRARFRNPDQNGRVFMLGVPHLYPDPQLCLTDPDPHLWLTEPSPFFSDFKSDDIFIFS
jgi:hypothetical protein